MGSNILSNDITLQIPILVSKICSRNILYFRQRLHFHTKGRILRLVKVYLFQMFIFSNHQQFLAIYQPELTISNRRVLTTSGDLDNALEEFSKLNVSTIIDKGQYGTKTQFVETLINQLVEQEQNSQLLDTINVVYLSQYGRVRSIKASQTLFNQLLYSPQDAFYGANSKTLKATPYYPDNTIYFISVREFVANPYKVSAPYPESKYQVLEATLKTDQPQIEPKLEKPFGYVFDTKLIFTGDQNNANTTDLDNFMEQTRYLSCITHNSNDSWGIGCEQQTLLHPNGKVLIQCNCYNLSTPLTLINDTDFKFFPNPVDPISTVPVQYVDISRAALLWVLIAIIIMWCVFAWIGYQRDLKSLKRHKIIGIQGKPKEAVKSEYQPQVQKLALPTLPKQFQKVVLGNDGDQQLVIPKSNEKNLIAQLQQETVKNDYVIAFDKESEGSKKKKKKKQTTDDVEKSPKDQTNLQTEGAEDKKIDLLNSHHGKQQSDQYMQPQQEEEEEEEEDDAEGEEEFDEDEEEGEGEENDSQQEEQKKNKVRSSLKYKQTVQEDQKQNKKAEKIIINPNEIGLKVSETQKEADKKQQEGIENQAQNQQNVPSVLYLELHVPSSVLFIQQRLHQLFGIFYYYKKTMTRQLRFLVNFCTIILTFALCGQLADMLPLGYNILAMFIGLLLVNWVESIVMIMLKQKETLSKMAAYVTMAGEIALSLYLIITSMINLLQLTHEIWLWTFITIELLDVFILEATMIVLKIIFQPFLQKHYESSNWLIRILFVTFWDARVQRLQRKLARMNQKSKEQQFHQPAK